jgi:hypothetical protein
VGGSRRACGPRGTTVVSGWLGQFFSPRIFDAVLADAPDRGLQTATKRPKGARQTEIPRYNMVQPCAPREETVMNSPSGLINLLIVWGVASATGFLAMAALMVAG